MTKLLTTTPALRIRHHLALRIAPWLNHPTIVAIPVIRLCECEQRIAQAIHTTP